MTTPPLDIKLSTDLALDVKQLGGIHIWGDGLRWYLGITVVAVKVD
jgi:hypothetical protein